MGWVKVASLADVPVGGMKRVVVDAEDIVVYRVEDGFYATSNVCTHAGESLSTGNLDGCVVACPKHGGKFDIRTGVAVAFPCVYPVQTYDVDVRGEEIWLEV